ncbi:four helix bundle protein [Poriferisphaera sp. WC338]|uniref:four helix bundle protein n=1 Tax=Poriferisphaera sp. WC338 TaxID=3425129 RepID=UPI003D8172AC
MSTHRPYEKLKVWQAAMSFTQQIYQITSTFPDSERAGLAATLRRHVMTLPARIADVASSDNTQLNIKLLTNTATTLTEIETTLLLCHRMRFIRAWPLRRLRKRAQNIRVLLEDQLFLLSEMAAIEYPAQAS